MSTFIVLSGVGFAFLGFAALMENTERGRRITRRLLIQLLGETDEPESSTSAYRQCCIAARAGRSEAGYWHHRVQDHGEGHA